MWIWDGVTLNDELDLLECRFTELDEVVDRFIVCEATTTQGTGRAKPLHYAEHQDRFAAWADRVVHVVCADLPGGPDPWPRERAQRDAVAQGLAGAYPSDLLLFGDVDEIPSAAAVRAAAANPGPSLFVMNLAFFAVDWVSAHPWLGTAAIRVADIPMAGVAQIREDRAGYAHVTGGWHLSWLGGRDGIAAKLADRCHRDENADIASRAAAGECYEGGRVWHSPAGGPERLRPADVDASWPRWVAERRCPPVWFRPR